MNNSAKMAKTTCKPFFTGVHVSGQIRSPSSKSYICQSIPRVFKPSGKMDSSHIFRIDRPFASVSNAAHASANQTGSFVRRPVGGRSRRAKIGCRIRLKHCTDFARDEKLWYNFQRIAGNACFFVEYDIACANGYREANSGGNTV